MGGREGGDILGRRSEGAYRFTKVVVKPTIVVAEEGAVEPVLEAINRAHRDCLVANSLLTTVIVEPDIRLRHAALCADRLRPIESFLPPKRKERRGTAVISVPLW